MKAILLLIGVLAISIAPKAHGTTITLDGTNRYDNYLMHPESDLFHWVEKGFTYQDSTAYNDGSFMVYMHDDGPGATSTTFQSVHGLRFDARKALLGGYSKVYRTSPDPYPIYLGDYEDRWKATASWERHVKVAYDNIQWLGYRDGQVVAQATTLAERLDKYKFGKQFRNLDALVANLLVPEGAFPTGGGGPDTSDTLWCFDTWCGGILLSQLTLKTRGRAMGLATAASKDTATPAPVPVPPALALLASGLLVLGGLSLKKRTS
jgi:hypothetical protein